MSCTASAAVANMVGFLSFGCVVSLMLAEDEVRNISYDQILTPWTMDIIDPCHVPYHVD